MGAGNITSIGPLDVLYQLFADSRVSFSSSTRSPTRCSRCSSARCAR
jgi:hypothetical protein